MSVHRKILITDMDGFNVHNPDRSSQFVEFRTIDQAVAYAEIVKKVGWDEAKYFLKTFEEILKPPSPPATP